MINGLKLHNPLDKEQLLNDISTKPGIEVANKYNVTNSRISQIKKANQSIIDQKKQEIIATLPTVVEIVANDVNTNKSVSKSLSNDINNLSTQDKLALKTILDKTTVNVLKIAGIYPSHP